MFGKVREVPQTEATPFYPRSPYGVAKAYGHFITVNYRESYDLHATSGILFNHESPRRGLEFVTRKITWHAAAIKHGLRDKLRLGNLDAERDWGYAKDYVEAMWLMLQQDEAEDYVIATGKTHSVRECVEVAFDEAGSGRLGATTSRSTGASCARPRSTTSSATTARPSAILGWKPQTSFEELIRLMTRRRPRARSELASASEPPGQARSCVRVLMTTIAPLVAAMPSRTAAPLPALRGRRMAARRRRRRRGRPCRRSTRRRRR